MASWHVVTMERATEDGCVLVAHWEAIDGAARVYGSVSLERPPVLIPYESLTQQICVGWIKDRVDVQSVEESLEKQLEQIDDPLTAVGLPW